ncbi:MAG: di-trans,poly-cis-decaprenylcistransferase [Clostridia bacterium]|nr:di-trans,poly-cis-decaprenylcistransferase [Clostridia bacterium]
MFGSKKQKEIAVDDRLSHIAFIMDGNGRYAKRCGMPREYGHKVGAKNFRTVAEYCFSIGIRYVTVYAFSTENWSRPEHEVQAIMSLLEEYLDTAAKESEQNNIRYIFLGDRSRLGDSLRGRIVALEKLTAEKKHVLSIALNYGARDELVHAVNALITEGKREVTEADVSAHLYTAGLPDPDLVVRTGGDFRVSNFLLWQSAYAEYYFTKTLWPELTKREINDAVADFYGRQRRFGGLGVTGGKK